MLPWSWLVDPGLHSCGLCNNSDGSTITNTEKRQPEGHLQGMAGTTNAMPRFCTQWQMDADACSCTLSLVLPARSQKVESLHLSPWLSRKEQPYYGAI
jgi:hypothetical protein